MNKAIVCGFLVRDPEENGKAVKFTLAVTRDYKNQENVYQSDFIRCVAFGTTGQLTKEYCKKGDLIGVDGQITTSKYEKDGKTVYNMEIMANKVRFLSSKGNSTPKQEKPSEPPKNESKLSDDVFELFNKQIEIDEEVGF